MWGRKRPTAAVESLMRRDDHVVSWARAGDQLVVASRFGLWWPEGDAHRMIGWELIDKAVWGDGRLTVIEADVVDDTFLIERPAVAVELTDPRDLPPTIRKRVESSVNRSEVVAVPGGSARFVARRVPGRDGVTWWVRLEGGLQPDEDVRETVGALLAELRSSA